MLKKKLGNQKGFTLIEIIAVLVILGILAAVAIPKFLDLQDDSRRAGARGFVAAAQSAISMGYASYLLGNNAGAGASPQAACATVVIDVPSGKSANVTCDATTWANSGISATYDGVTVTGNWTKP